MILRLIMKQLQSRLIMQLRFNFLHATIERFSRICDGLPMNFAIYIWRWTWSQFEINQKLLDEVKWGQQWGLDIEYIKVLSVKAMKATFGTEFGTFLEIIIVFSSWCYEY